MTQERRFESPPPERRFEPPPLQDNGVGTPETTLFTVAPSQTATRLTAALEKVGRRWLGVPGVEAVSQTQTATGEDALRIMVTDQAALTRLSPQLPTQVDGLPVIVEISGEFKAL